MALRQTAGANLYCRNIDANLNSIVCFNRASGVVINPLVSRGSSYAKTQTYNVVRYTYMIRCPQDDTAGALCYVCSIRDAAAV